MPAGDALIDVCDRSPAERNELIYPILFSYCHALEMAMKWIISRYGRPAGVAPLKKDPPKKDHNLWHLWQSCKTIFEYSCQDPDGTNEVVEKIIKEAHDLHSGSLAFRYHINKQGVLYPLPDGPIDFANLRDVMRRVSGFFDGADAMLDDLASCDDLSSYDAWVYDD